MHLDIIYILRIHTFDEIANYVFEERIEGNNFPNNKCFKWERVGEFLKLFNTYLLIRTLTPL